MSRVESTSFPTSGLTNNYQISEVKLLSHVQLFVTPWTVAYQAPLSMEFSKQEYWSGVPFPSPQLWGGALKFAFLTTSRRS